MNFKHILKMVAVAALVVVIPSNLTTSFESHLIKNVKGVDVIYPKPEYPVIGQIQNLSAKSASLYDLDAHKFIYTYNATQTEFSASTSKLMAMYVIYQKMVNDPKLKWSDQVKIKYDGISRLSTTPGVGEIPLTLGKSYSAQQLAENAMVVSSNESITALGIWAYGSNSAMIDAMNTAAKELELHQTHYYTVSGLDVADVTPYALQLPGAPADGKNTSSAYDLTMLAQALLTKYPQILKLTSIPSVTINGVIHQSTDRYLKGFEDYDVKHGIDGLKTGTTPAAGEVFVGTSILPGQHRIISVVMHANDRFADTTKLLAVINR